MSYRSWLKDARSIHDLKPTYIPKAGTWDDRQDDLKEAKARELFRRPLPVAPEFVPFFGSRMHDSTILETDRSVGIFTVRLDAIQGQDFAWSWAKVSGTEYVPSQWRVDLVFHDAVYVRAARQDSTGALRFFDLDTIQKSGSERNDDFLYDWFYEQDGRVQWIAELWAMRKERAKLSPSVFLMVDCARVSVVDHRSEAIREEFGLTAQRVWLEMLAGVDVGDKWLGYEGEMESYIRRRISSYEANP